jgi:hypothetical protein
MRSLETCKLRVEHQNLLQTFSRTSDDMEEVFSHTSTVLNISPGKRDIGD